MSQDPSVVPVFPADFDRVVPLLQRLDDRRAASAWRPIFDYGWRQPADPVGYAVMNGGGAAGFVGTIFSEVTVDGRPERVCNITSWVTGEAASGAGALLMLPLHRMRDATLTSLSSNAQARRVLLRLGFRTLDESWTVLGPTARLARTPREARCRVVGMPREMEALLSDPDRRILHDHLPYARHLVAACEDGYCFAVYSVRRRWRLPAARFHYVSDRQRFARCWPAIHRWLLGHHGTAFGEMDSRLLAGVAIAGSLRKAMWSPRLFRSATLRTDQVADLYNEIILLGIL